ncbi:MAG TPA: phosphoribosylanthranilate isomerase [Phycisphaerales bacterium]|nr:phosphoribosylanthranilate isomerase [Phycisphaerales bacterium]
MKYSFLRQLKPSIKICGLKSEEEVDIAVGAGADAIGFVFAKDSPRCIDRSHAARLILQLPPEILPVAVVQNYDDLQDFSDWPGWLQLCGEEDAQIISSAPCPVIKALQWNKDEVKSLDTSDHIEAILIDGSTGGLGEMFDIDSLEKIIDTLKKPIIVAGGLTPTNVAEVIKKVHPSAVDVSSGIESSRGVKDIALMCEFIEAVIQTRDA